MSKSSKNNKSNKVKKTHKILSKLDAIHKRTQALFEEDAILLGKLKREINARQRKAS